MGHQPARFLGGLVTDCRQPRTQMALPILKTNHHPDFAANRPDIP